MLYHCCAATSVCLVASFWCCYTKLPPQGTPEKILIKITLTTASKDLHSHNSCIKSAQLYWGNIFTSWSTYMRFHDMMKLFFCQSKKLTEAGGVIGWKHWCILMLWLIKHADEGCCQQGSSFLQVRFQGHFWVVIWAECDDSGNGNTVKMFVNFGPEEVN